MQLINIINIILTDYTLGRQAARKVTKAMELMGIHK